MAENAENLNVNPPTQPIPPAQSPGFQNANPPTQPIPPAQSPGFFQEDNGTYSSMRLMCFVSLIAAILFGLVTLWICYKGGNDNGNGVLLTFGFLVGAFAPKAVQKFAEQKVPSKG